MARKFKYVFECTVKIESGSVWSGRVYGVGERMEWRSVRNWGVYGVGEGMEWGRGWSGGVYGMGVYYGMGECTMYRVRECIKWGSVWTWEGHFLIFGAKIQILFKLGKYSFAFISFTST